MCAADAVWVGDLQLLKNACSFHSIGERKQIMQLFFTQCCQKIQAFAIVTRLA